MVAERFRETDWLRLWRELVLRSQSSHPGPASESAFASRERAAAFEEASQKKGATGEDALLAFIRGNLTSHDTVLDIGGGTGRLAIPLARVARHVTVVEPAPGMREILMTKMHQEGLDNLTVIPQRWEEADGEPHDIVICAHAMYASPDLAAFVGKMVRCARRRSYLIVKLTPPDGVMAELARHIYGTPHDSPNFTIAYNALCSLGIFGNVLVEAGFTPWTSPDLAAALARAKRHLCLGDSTRYDDYTRATLTRRLIPRDGVYLWPDGMRSALIWWEARPKLD